MAEDHPNVALLMRLDLQDLVTAKELIADDFVLHFFNPLLPDIEGDYRGLDGFQALLSAMAERTGGNFHVEPVSVTAYGDELVVTHTRNSLTLDGRPITVDVVVVWRIVEGQIAEAWDIPSVHAVTA